MASPIVQNANNTGATVTSLSVTLSGVTAGNSIFFAVGAGAASDTFTVSDTAGTLTTASFQNTNEPTIGQYVEFSAAAGTHTFSVTISTARYVAIFAAELQAAQAASLDGSNFSTTFGTTATVVTPTQTPTVSGDLAIGFMALQTGQTSPWANGLTNGYTLQDSAGSTTVFNAAWGYLAGVSAATSTGTTIPAADNWTSSLILFKAASGGSSATGSAAVDESSDIAAGSGAISIAASGATTEGADTASGAGSVSIAGAASAAESADTASAVGTAGSSITGSGAAAEVADVAAGTGAVSIAGAGAATEQRDSASGAASISVSATGAVHEGADVAAGVGALSVSGAATATEGADAAAAAGSLSIGGAAAVTEGADKAAGTGSATGTLGAPGSIPSVARYTIRRQVARNFAVWRSFPRNFTVRRSLVRVFEVNSVSIRFPVKGPAEATPLTFDFSADLPSGVTLSGAPTMSIACTEGTDANAANVISGSVALNAGKTAVVQDGTGGLDGCEYTITCTCATTQSNLTLTLVGIRAVRANLN